MGGKAFDNTRRIYADEIPGVLNLISRWTGIRDPETLGSAGKVETSGDLDINVCQETYAFDDILEALEDCLPAESIKKREANNQIFASFPILGTRDFVQVDFMFGIKDWQEFSYFSAGRGIDAGIYRTELLKALTTFKSDMREYEGGELIARSGPSFLHPNGIVWRQRHRPFHQRKPGVRVKAFKIIPIDEFNDLYGNAIHREPITDPDMAKSWLLPGHEDFDTFAQVWEGINTVYPYDLGAIRDLFMERMASLRHEPIPEILSMMERK